MPRYVFSQGDIRVKKAVDLSGTQERRHALQPAYLLIVDPVHATPPPHAANTENKETPDVR
jgi:hypothetical protein